MRCMYTTIKYIMAPLQAPTIPPVALDEPPAPTTPTEPRGRTHTQPPAPVTPPELHAARPAVPLPAVPVTPHLPGLTPAEPWRTLRIPQPGDQPTTPALFPPPAGPPPALPAGSRLEVKPILMDSVTFMHVEVVL